MGVNHESWQDWADFEIGDRINYIAPDGRHILGTVTGRVWAPGNGRLNNRKVWSVDWDDIGSGILPENLLKGLSP